MKVLKGLFIGLMVFSLALAGQVAYAVIDEIDENTCIVYPNYPNYQTGDDILTEAHPLFGDYTYPEYKYTKDLDDIQKAVLKYDRVILSNDAPFQLGICEDESIGTATITSNKILITKDVVIEGADVPMDLPGRTTLIGGTSLLNFYPNEPLYYRTEGVPGSQIKVKYHMANSAGKDGDDPTKYVQCFFPEDWGEEGHIPTVTIKHLDSEQASAKFILFKAARNSLVDDVKISKMERPWENFPEYPGAVGKWLMPIEIVPGYGSELTYPRSYVESVTISNCIIEAIPNDPTIGGISLLLSNTAGDINIINNNKLIAQAGSTIGTPLMIVRSGDADIEVKDNELEIWPNPDSPASPPLGIYMASGSNGASFVDNKIKGIAAAALWMQSATTRLYITGCSANVFDPYAPYGTNNSFSFTTLPPEAALECLRAKVEDYHLQQGIDNSLDKKLGNVLGSLTAANAEQRQDAVNKLNAFINQCTDQSGDELTVEQAEELIADAEKIIDALNRGY
jgi:hypothetical protein